ncbi:LemA family protein [Patescibacteria group bacterium]|nr:LemA family protein [Patescibacteria group bacterium]MDE1946666.1 LemA family protein [Patescibacteria group bacterium]MDE2010619.1 LemA family protein [Patescibacteria group bacterium]MDE2232934.1 LemA family protein [Patescibacteria group bacterium]
MSIISWAILILVVLLIIWAIAAFNRLVSLSNRAKEAWADIDVQLKRRYDLIPNLVNTVKGYAAHEKTAFENVTKARAVAMGAGNMAEKGQAEATLAGALKSVFAIAEAYPELKANQNFLALQSELTDTEDKIQAARRFYNGNVRDLNIYIQAFPGNMIAGAFHFTTMEFFQLDESDAATKEPVKVQF